MSDLLNTPASYGDDAIVTLTPREHIRLRPGMYIGKLGDGSQPDDGIYVLIKEVVDNSVDEFIMGAGKQIEITVADNVVTVRDYGRGIPLKSLAAAVSEMNTGGKYGGTAFKKTVGLNGVGVKAVNMLSSEFTARSVRDGEARTVTFAQGIEQSDRWESGVEERNGTLISFRVDEEVFGAYAYNMEYVEEMVKNYTYLNLGLTFKLNGQSYVSKNGLLDLLNEKMSDAPLYAPIHLSGDDIEVAITHGSGYGESYYSFVNGQYTSQGGTHQAAFREAIAKTVKEFYHKDYDASDIRTSIIAAISVKVTDPVFESQTKIKLGSKEIEPGVSMRNFVLDFIGKHLDDYLHKHAETAQVLQKKIVENEKERKAISGIQKKARETAKKVSLNNKKLRDCKIHLTDRNDLAEQSMIFITEGNSASGSITTSRDVRTQAVQPVAGGAQHRGGYGQPALQQGHHRHRCRCRRNAHPAAADDLLPAILPRRDPRRPSLYPPNAAVPRAQQAGNLLLLYRRGATAGDPQVRRAGRNHAFQGFGRDLGRRVQGVHRRTDAAGQGASDEGRSHSRHAGVLHGQELARTAGVHRRQSPHRGGYRGGRLADRRGVTAGFFGRISD